MTPSPAVPAPSLSRPGFARALDGFIPVVGLLGLLAMGLFYRAHPELEPIRSDGYGHYLYLPAVFVQHDLSMRTEVAEWGENWDPNIGLTEDPRTGRYLNRFPPGQALLMLPAFLVAHAYASVTGGVPDGFSTPYQVMAALNGWLALLVGLALLRRALSALFSPGVVLATLAAVTLGTNLFHYGTYDAIFSHVYSFALFAALLVVLPEWYREPTARRSVVLGLVAGFIVLVRNPNAVVLLLVPLYGVVDGATQRARLAFFRANARQVALVSLAFLAVVGVLIAYWHFVTGAWLVYSYRGYGFRFDHPQVLPVLFSVRKGLFFWAPVWLFAVAGFGKAREQLEPYVLPVFLFFLLHTFLVASWWHWPYGGSFGHRAYTEASALFALGLAGLFTSLRRPASRAIVGGLTVGLVLLQCFLMVQYWRNVLPPDRTTWAKYQSLFVPGP
ncbi:hypothetical protein KRR26_29670 [Corallococcus sp. M34]|uniref:hypothetical protein n=1 Tax=Citreicoccus inhibens TaxID=2849499 RepID=UPI001C22A3CD|nr:hypothetical protein [Citreicoccus inhibens]MBU8899788.1 hypothetical protein [Citreicoccus inhibens]